MMCNFFTKTVKTSIKVLSQARASKARKKLEEVRVHVRVLFKVKMGKKEAGKKNEYGWAGRLSTTSTYPSTLPSSLLG